MFKDAILNKIIEISNEINSIGQNGYLSQSLASFNSTLYQYVLSISNNVCLPVAYSILALMFVLELTQLASKYDGAGGGVSFGAEIVFRTMFKFVLCKTAVDYTHQILMAIFDTSLQLVQKMTLNNVSIDSGLNVAQMQTAVDGISGMGNQTTIWFETLIVGLIIKGILILVNVVVICRFMELYVYISIAPIPFATLANEKTSDIGKNFIKKFTAVSLQGVFIFLVLGMFPVFFKSGLINSQQSDAIGSYILPLLGYCIVLAVGIFSCSKWAKSVCNAM